MPAISSIWPGKPTTKYSPLATTIQRAAQQEQITAEALSQAKRARSGVPGGLARHSRPRWRPPRPGTPARTPERA